MDFVLQISPEQRRLKSLKYKLFLSIKGYVVHDYKGKIYIEMIQP